MATQIVDRFLQEIRNAVPTRPRDQIARRSRPLYADYLLKSDVNTRKGIITSYITSYYNQDGSPYIDPYNDIIAPGAFSGTIKALEIQRHNTNSPWLCPTLWQHSPNEVIGGVKGLTEDSRGVIQETHLALGVQRARDVLELAEKKMIGVSYGYDPLNFQMLPGGTRKLTTIGLKETSFVTFPANQRAEIIGIKNYDESDEFEAMYGVSAITYELQEIACKSAETVLWMRERRTEKIDAAWYEARARAANFFRYSWQK